MKGRPTKETTMATHRSTKSGEAKTMATKASTATAKLRMSLKPKPSQPRISKSSTAQPKDQPLIRSRSKFLRTILLAKREAIMKQIREQLGQSLTDDQQRRFESAMDSGDQALFDLEREMGISLQEMWNRERQMIEEALSSLEDGTYGQCAECDAEISEKRLEVLPFARYCIACQSRMELLEKIEKGEQRT